MESKVRLDKWLWAVRLYKTRTLAAAACDGGKIKSDGQALKPAKAMVPGMEFTLLRGGIRYRFKVVQVIDKRVSATLAGNCYEDLTPEEEMAKQTKNPLKSSFVQPAIHRPKGAGRPSKKDRRDQDRFNPK